MRSFSYNSNPLLTWFRIYGYGLCFRSRKFSRYELTFSEKNGYKKYFKTPWHIITVVKPNSQ